MERRDRDRGWVTLGRFLRLLMAVQMVHNGWSVPGRFSSSAPPAPQAFAKRVGWGTVRLVHSGPNAAPASEPTAASRRWMWLRGGEAEVSCGEEDSCPWDVMTGPGRFR